MSKADTTKMVGTVYILIKHRPASRNMVYLRNYFGVDHLPLLAEPYWLICWNKRNEKGIKFKLTVTVNVKMNGWMSALRTPKLLEREDISFSIILNHFDLVLTILTHFEPFLNNFQPVGLFLTFLGKRIWYSWRGRLRQCTI